MKAIISSFPERFGCYHEPFVGGGAVFFSLDPESAALSDANGELMNCYTIVRDEVDRLIRWLGRQVQTKEHYYRIRAHHPRNEVERAGRLIYLNRTAFNGIWRVNQRGQFNVPYGFRPRNDLVAADNLRRASAALKGVNLRVIDYSVALSDVKPGDLVYVDPPYTVRHENNGFRKYNEVLFSWADQQNLASTLHALADSGVTVVASNAHDSAVRTLYKGFSERVILRSSRLAASPKARGDVKESLFVRMPENVYPSTMGRDQRSRED